MAIQSGTTGNDTLFGGNTADTLSGAAGNDYIRGYEGSDSLDGGSGNDTLAGNLGNDTLDGGDGTDEAYYHYDNAVTVNLAGLYDSQGQSLGYNSSGAQGNDVLVGIENLYGSKYDDNLTGDANNNYIYGGDGNDTLKGGQGADTLNGFWGNDTYFVTDNDDVIVDNGGTKDVAFVSASFVKIPSTIESVTYSNGALALPYWIDALLPDEAAGQQFDRLLGSSNIYYYHFLTSVPSYEKIASLKVFSSNQMARTELALNYIKSLINVDFQRTESPYNINTLTFAYNQQKDSAGEADYPNDAFRGSGVWLNDVDYNTTLADESYGALVLIHEIGHAIGLKHPFEITPNLPDSEDSTTWTVMSYTQNSSEYYLKYSPLDIAALQYLYGPSATARTANDTYSISTTDPNFIWDGNGNDTLDGSAITQPIKLYLTPGYWGYIGASAATTITSPGQITINFGSSIENAIGGSNNDDITGNTADNALSGGDGADTLAGGNGNDTIDGGAGTDSVIFDNTYSAYSLTPIMGSTIKVSNSIETDTVSNVERFKFKDIWYASDLNATNAAQVIYASFGKDYIKSFLAPGIGLVDSGLTLNGLCEIVTNNKLVEKISGDSTTKGYVNTIFNNVVGRFPTVSEAQTFTTLLDSGSLTRQGFLYSAADYGLTASAVEALKVDLIGIPYNPG